jgi:CDP-glycerol glycerophosphotransferase
MKVSVIVPFQKGLSFLEDCLQSLADQTYKDMEIILVCDHVEEDFDAFIKTYQPLMTLKIYHLEDKT